MSRHSDDLERLCNKLERRFGKADSLLLQAKAELETYKSYVQMAPCQHDWSTPYGAFIKAWSMHNLPKFPH
jgi:hypothetical protein